MSPKEHYVNHLYGVLQEECAELIMAISKRNRFGGNEENINNEINDVMAMIEMLAHEGESVHENISLQMAKDNKVNIFYGYTFNKDFPVADDGPKQYRPTKILV